MTAPLRPGTDFRPELQALRAVAVALVVVYHLWPKYLPGGFVGVDVFFVISGYLITSHLLREVTRSGRIAVTGFWARRIRRLLPAAFTVLAVSAVATLLWLPRAVWQQTFVEIIASAVYGVNWVLAFNATDYLGAENDPSIVQHYWSLSVEEQFYIVWPLLMVIAIAIAAWRARRPGAVASTAARTHAITIMLLIVVVASFAYSIAETSASQPFAFFATPARAWEFGAGALLAIAGTSIDRVFAGARGDTLRSAASWAGLIIIAVSAFALNADSAFPGFIAAVPVIGTLLVIAAGTPRARWSPMVVGRLAPVQVVGDLSYSIYLWHWPLIIVYPHIVGRGRGVLGSLAIIALSVGLAWLTKRFIEDPVRNGAFWKARMLRSYGIAVVGAVVTIALCAVPLVVIENQRQATLASNAAALNDGVPCFGAAALADDAECPDPFAIPDNLDTAFADADRGLLSDKTCKTDAQGGSEVRRCDFGSTAPDAVGLALIGNSHGNALASGLAPYSATQDWHLTTYFRQSCLGDVRVGVGDAPSADCLAWTSKVLDEILADDTVSVVIYQSYQGFALGTDDEITPGEITEYERNVRTVWAELAQAGKSVIVVSDVPGTRPDNTPECIANSPDEYDPCSTNRFGFMTNNAMYVAAEGTPGVTTIDLTRYFCDDKRCHSLIGGVVVYFDSHHLTATYARTLAPYLGADIQRVIDRRG